MIATAEHPPAIIRPNEWKVRFPAMGISEVTRMGQYTLHGKAWPVYILLISSNVALHVRFNMMVVGGQ
jgi:hypothetical protein